jgi:hypothetical protein
MTHLHKTTQLGELIAAAFDQAGLHSSDPREVSRLATQSISRILGGALRISVSMPMSAARSSAS